MKRETQCNRLLNLLQSANGGWVSLPEILGLFLGSHSRRIYEIRQRGFKVEIDDRWVKGERRTRYRLVTENT